MRKRLSAPSAGQRVLRDRLVSLDSRAIFLLSQIGHHLATSFAERTTSLGIGPRHFALLHHLATQEGQSQQALADQLRIHRNVMVGAVDDLERLGLARREPHPADRRAYALRLTPRGRSVVKTAHVAADALEADAMRSLSDAERLVLIQQLQRVADSLGLSPELHPALADAR